MIRDEKLIAIIPVRGGSKGIPGKNLYKIGGETLLERAIKLAKQCDCIDQILVSTDHPEMYATALDYGVATHSPRPDHLATDSANIIDVLIHTLDEAKIEHAYVLLLEVTSPLRTLDDLKELCRVFENDKEARAIASVCQHLGTHPDKTQKIENGVLSSYLGKSSHLARQTLPEVYDLNGAFYLAHTDDIRLNRTLLPAKTIPFVMPAERSVNLDSLSDLYVLEALINRNLVQ